MKHTRLWWWVVAVMLVPLVAGCGQRITAEEIVERMRETLDTTRDAHAVLVADAQVQGMALALSAEVWEQTPNRFRIEVLDASLPEFDGMVMVVDGEQAWLYEPASNRVRVGEAGVMDVPLPQEMLGHLQEVIQGVLDASDVELVGEDTVAGHEAYTLVLTPKEGEDVPQVIPAGGEATVWVDKEEGYVLKAEFDSEALGRGSLEVQSFELNPGLPDELFAFEIPDGAEVIEVTGSMSAPLTLDEARERVDFQLLVPAHLPDGATLIEVAWIGDALDPEYDAIVLQYDLAPGASFAVMQAFPAPQAEEQAGAPGVDRTEITVRGHQGWLVTHERLDRRFVTWTENGVHINIGGQISEEELLKVAESLE
jgi:outer membrane lipoprotein-sorting protein